MEIVFVHAGSAPLPEHLIDNLLFLKKTTHKTPIKVLSQADYECLLPEDIRSDKRFTFVPIETLQEGSESLAFKERSMMPKDIMNGFWFHTSYRFFLILDYMRQQGATNVLHLESDVVLLIDPTELEPVFVDFAEFAVTMDRIRAIPGIVWFKSALAAEALAQFMNSNTSVTDMESIGRFVEQFYGFAKPLPTIPRDYVERKGLPLNRYCDGVEQFGGIFDAAAIGQYVRGVHWINKQGNTRGFQNESSDLILSEYQIGYHKHYDSLTAWIQDDVPTRHRILSLHLHSKNLKSLTIERSLSPVRSFSNFAREFDIVLTEEPEVTCNRIARHICKSKVLSAYDLEFASSVPELYATISAARKILIYSDQIEAFLDYIVPNARAIELLAVVGSISHRSLRLLGTRLPNTKLLAVNDWIASGINYFEKYALLDNESLAYLNSLKGDKFVSQKVGKVFLRRLEYSVNSSNSTSELDSDSEPKNFPRNLLRLAVDAEIVLLSDAILEQHPGILLYFDYLGVIFYLESEDSLKSGAPQDIGDYDLEPDWRRYYKIYLQDF
jgi:hypothetical protein